MKHIWRVTVYLADSEPVKFGGYDVFNVEAVDDIQARKRGMDLMKQAHNENIEVKWVETEHVLDYEEMPE